MVIEALLRRTTWFTFAWTLLVALQVGVILGILVRGGADGAAVMVLEVMLVILALSLGIAQAVALRDGERRLRDHLDGLDQLRAGAPTVPAQVLGGRFARLGARIAALMIETGQAPARARVVLLRALAPEGPRLVAALVPTASSLAPGAYAGVRLQTSDLAVLDGDAEGHAVQDDPRWKDSATSADTRKQWKIAVVAGGVVGLLLGLLAVIVLG